MRNRLTSTITGLAVAVALLSPALASGDVFNVTKRGDHAPGACTNGDCTVREAVIAANTLPGDDRVKLPSRKPYNLTRELGVGPDEASDGDLDIDSGLGNLITVAHPGQGLATIDATGGEDRAIELVGAATLKRIKLRDGEANSTGEAGGALFVDGNVALVRSRIAGSHAADVGGGIFITDGTLEMRRSTVRGNDTSGEGGGIFVDDDARFEIAKSTLAGNEGDDGGGLFSSSEEETSTLVTSTVSGNTSTEEGGGLWNGGNLFVTNSTIADNTADGSGGGLYAAPDSLAGLEFVTIARNRADADDTGPHEGGGIFADGGDDVVVALGTLLARNRTTGGTFQDCDAPAPVGITTSGDNLVTTEQDCPFFDDTEDIVEDEPLIGVLADNGGPTETVKLKQDSPAIDAAAGAPNKDQRGVSRSEPGDIGAFERE